jgi:hypothetical protein
MDLDSYPHLLRGGRNHWFTTMTFSIHGVVSPDFGLMGCVSSGAHRGASYHVLVVLYPLIYLHSHHKQIGFYFVESLAIATCL